MGIVIISCYKPKAGKSKALHKLMETHLEILAKEGLVTDRKSILCQAKDETILEVFEWKSREHLASAHENPAVQKMWAEYAEVCDYIPVSDLDEVSDLFSGFTPLN
jgi:hypothetical protein